MSDGKIYRVTHPVQKARVLEVLAEHQAALEKFKALDEEFGCGGRLDVEGDDLRWMATKPVFGCRVFSTGWYGPDMRTRAGRAVDAKLRECLYHVGSKLSEVLGLVDMLGRPGVSYTLPGTRGFFFGHPKASVLGDGTVLITLPSGYISTETPLGCEE